MTLPTIATINSDPKSAAAATATAVSMTASYTNADEQSIGSDVPPMYTHRIPFTQNMPLLRLIARTILGMTAIISVVTLLAIWSSGGECECLEAYQAQAAGRGSPFYEPLTAASGEDGARRRVPLRIQLGGGAEDMMRKNSKGHMNCVVERKAATQIIAAEPKTLVTPYGNITTDPKLIHITGEKMIFSCSPQGKDKDKEAKKLKLKERLLALEKEREKQERTDTPTDQDPASNEKDPWTDKKDDNETSANSLLRAKREVISSKSDCACDCSC